MAAEEIGFIERFALAEDRDAVLDELIPGTEDFYYYHALHHQNEGRFGEVEQVLEPWVKRHGETQRVWEIRHRQALLLYPNQPEKSLTYLRERLNLRFNHQREKLGQKPDFPTSLDPELITWEAFRKRAFAESKTVDKVADSGLDRILRSDVELDPTRRRSLLSRLKYPDYPNLVGLIAADLRTKESKGFGEHKIHRELLPEQLDELDGLRPELASNHNFVHARLAKLAPSADVGWRRDTVERQAYLERMWDYVKPLANSFNSLKAHVLYQLLDHHRRQGDYPRQLFLTYVKLPRPVGYAEPRWLQQNENRGSAQVDLNSDFRAITQTPPIGPRDEPLVRDYLMKFFVGDDSWEVFAPYIRDTWLKPVFAEAKIVNGIGDAEKWSSLLSPSAFKNLRDRVDVAFAIDNPAEFSAADPVKLDLHIKNVENLMVKVYQINALSYYLTEKAEINTDLNLDGLVANSEQAKAYDEAPLRRVRRSFEFPELANQRGTWVIEFIGNGISSRALVRKGRLQYLAHPSAAGTVLTVLDAQNQLAEKPAAWFGGRRYTPDEKGRILVPFSTQGGEQALVLTDADDSVATLEFLQQASENYQLEAGFHVERETLLPGRRTTVAVRPRFTLNGNAVPTSLLKNVRLTVDFIDADGIDSMNTVEDFELHDDRESEYVFRVPERVRAVGFSLEAEVEKLSAGGEDVRLEAGDEDSSLFHLNQVDDSQFIGDLHLTKIDGNYLVEVLGKTGEPLADRAVEMQLIHRDFQSTIRKSLKSDENGRIRLGKLEDIKRLAAVSADGSVLSHVWPLTGDRHTYPASLHAAADKTIEIPLMENRDKLTAADIALFQMRGGALVANHIDKLELADGLIKIAGLTPGDYQIVLRPPSAAESSAGRVIDLKVTSGEASRDYLLGQHRHLQIKNTAPLQIASITEGDDDTVRIQLKNADKFTRVHVSATHFIPEYPLYGTLGDPLWSEPTEVHRGDAASRYVSGRDIGEEYRYILERRDAEKFPGNMLARPGLILNPWELAKTDTATDEASAGADYKKSKAMKRSSHGAAAKAPIASPAMPESLGLEGGTPTLDFLHLQAPVAYNLAPDEDGVITLKREVLGDRQHLHVLAINTDNTAYRQLSLPEPKGGTVVSDLRLLTGPTPAEHFSQRRKVTVLGKGDALKIADRRSSEMQVYDTLAGVYATLAGISNDPTFAEFSFILRWPTLDEKDKRRLYSEYACHELNFFLSRRDTDFFQTVVQPYLANKKDKTFFDHYLLEQNLDSYLQAWRYGRLNTAERILLARRLGGDELINTSRHIREGWELIPVDQGQQQHWFFQALRGRAGGADYGVFHSDDDAMADGAVVDNFAAPAPASRGMLGRRRLAELAPADRPAPQAVAAGAVVALRMESKKQDNLDVELAAVMDMEAEEADEEMLAEAGKDLQRLRRAVRANFRKLGQTREWAENNYYHLPIGQQTADLIAVNAFWQDYAEWKAGDDDEATGFSSREFPAAANSFAEMMLALSLLDLPFAAGEHDIEIDEQSLTLTAASTAVVFHEEIESVPVAENPPPLLVSQNFFREGDRVRYEGNEQVDKFVTDEFLTGVVYGGQVVITNPTSSNQRLEVLLQIPVGALPANGSEYTRSTPVQLGAFSTERMEYFFYFPASSGKENFAHYPVHVARDEKAIAWADAFTFKVVDELSAVDTSSWDYLSQHGSQQEVIAFLEQNNVQRLDLGRIAWRVREDDAFLRKVISLLDDRHAYDNTLWSYGIHHNHVPTIRQFLLHQENFLAQSGRWLRSDLVNIEPVERHWFQQLDYSPLVNARQHQLGRDRKILNDRFRGQYQQLMHVLSYQTEFAANDDLAIAAYLMLQDRVGDGLARLEKVDREQVATKLQLDLIDAHAALYRGDADKAGQIAARHAEHPVDRWRDRFVAVTEQVLEIKGAQQVAAADDAEKPDRDQQQEALAGSEPSFDFSIEGNKLQLTHRNLEEVQLNFYEMDLEFLFSSNPFVARDSSRFRYIRPNFTQTKKLKASDDKQQAIDIPERFRGKNVLIEVVGAGIRKTEAWYANDLAVQVVENYGHLQVSAAAKGKTGDPLPKAYVKVYARYHDGSVKFFKDGYTDLRGKFDYISLNTDELDRVERFALLVISEGHGALVRKTAPPQQ